MSDTRSAPREADSCGYRRAGGGGDHCSCSGEQGFALVTRILLHVNEAPARGQGRGRPFQCQQARQQAYIPSYGSSMCGGGGVAVGGRETTRVPLGA